MKKYPVVAVIWEDHIEVHRSELPENVDELFERPSSLSIGALIQETDKSLLIASGIERFDDRTDVSYIGILKSTVVSIKRFGTIPLELD